MTSFLPEIYQQAVLDSIETYFRACLQLGDADTAFYQTTRELWGEGSKYHSIAGFSSDMPYLCLRVPIGGDKTRLAAKSVALINTHLLRREHSVILWLVPSKVIREQTLKALRNAQHPCHVALREAGPLTVLDMNEAKNVTRATLETSTACREDTEWLKVYQSSGALGWINFWVRNLVRKEGCSFFLQKTDGRFYPDFLCQLPGGVILAVEFKGADRWKEAEDDRLIGGLWAELSDGRCRFVMVKDKKWERIEARLSGATA